MKEKDLKTGIIVLLIICIVSYGYIFYNKYIQPKANVVGVIEQINK